MLGDGVFASWTGLPNRSAGTISRVNQPRSSRAARFAIIPGVVTERTARLRVRRNFRSAAIEDRYLVGQRHFRGPGTGQRVPLLAVANNRTIRKMDPQPQAVQRARTHRDTAWSCG